MDLDKYIQKKQRQRQSGQKATVEGMGGKTYDNMVYTGKGPDNQVQTKRPTQRRINKNGEVYYVDEGEAVVVDNETLNKWGGPDRLHKILKNGGAQQQGMQQRQPGVPDGMKGNGMGQGTGQSRQGLRKQFYMGGVPGGTMSPEEAENPYNMSRGQEPGKGWKRPYGAQADMLSEVQETGRPQFQTGGVSTDPFPGREQEIKGSKARRAENFPGREQKILGSKARDAISKAQEDAQSRAWEDRNQTSYTSPSYRKAQDEARQDAISKAQEDAQSRAWEDRNQTSYTSPSYREAMQNRGKTLEEQPKETARPDYGMVTEQDEGIYNRRLRDMQNMYQSQRAKEAQQMRQQGLSEEEIQGRLQRSDVSRRQSIRDSMAQMAESGASRRAAKELKEPVDKTTEELAQSRNNFMATLQSMEGAYSDGDLDWDTIMGNEGAKNYLVDMYNLEFAEDYDGQISREDLKDPDVRSRVQSLYESMARDAAMTETDKLISDYLQGERFQTYNKPEKELSEEEYADLRDEYLSEKGIDPKEYNREDMLEWRQDKSDSMQAVADAFREATGPAAGLHIEGNRIYNPDGSLLYEGDTNLESGESVTGGTGGTVPVTDYDWDPSRMEIGTAYEVSAREGTKLEQEIASGNIPADSDFLNRAGGLTIKKKEDGGIQLVTGKEAYDVDTSGPAPTIDGAVMDSGMQNYLESIGAMDEPRPNTNDKGQLVLDTEDGEQIIDKGAKFAWKGEYLQYNDDGSVNRLEDRDDVLTGLEQKDIFPEGDVTNVNRTLEQVEKDIESEIELEMEDELDGLSDVEKAKKIADNLHKKTENETVEGNYFADKATKILDKANGEYGSVRKQVVDFIGSKSLEEQMQDPFYWYLTDKFESMFPGKNHTINEIGNVHNKIFETKGDNKNVRGFTQFPDRDDYQEDSPVMFKDPDTGAAIFAQIKGIGTKGDAGGKRAVWHFELPNGQKVDIMGPGDHGDVETENAQAGYTKMINDIAYLASKPKDEIREDGYQLTFYEDSSAYKSSDALNRELDRKTPDESRNILGGILGGMLGPIAGGVAEPVAGTMFGIGGAMFGEEVSTK